MKKNLALGIMVCISCFIYAQNNDLIITIDGDSLACEIVEVNDSEVILNMKYDFRKVQTTIKRNKIEKYQYDVIQEDLYRYKSGTSYIIGEVYTLPPDTYYPISSGTYSLENLQTASNEELGYYLFKAKQKKKTGKMLSIGGPVTSGLGLAMFSASWSGNFGGSFTAGAGLIMFIGGIGVTIVGLPILITGSSRVKRINDLKSNSPGTINIELVPCRFNNQLAQSSQSGVTLRIKF